MFLLKNTQIFIVCISLIIIGAIFEPLISQPIFSLISLLSGIGGIVGGVCAVFAFFQWREQVHHGKKLDVLEALEKVHLTGSSLDMAVGSMYLDMMNFAENEGEDVKNQYKERYKLSHRRYLKGVDKINLLHAELLVKSRLLEVINQDHKVHILMTNVISVGKEITLAKIPESLQTGDEARRIVGFIFHHFGNNNNKVCSEYRNYLHNSLK
ncbi:hypothetical protein SIO17_17590 [Pseudoalteromonas piscicida]|uniref:DUF4760 domain-containing protein n=1 Tax=Pseudoalteromonas piscicida TaxID=43662 RepID=A0ABM6NIR2_PSEO7|nr:hypothetical protein [Pseudoalteromonas piscicida]ATD08885.1 hypothetical protein PPIS_a4227 [Pseudoalteromonas piscicida]WPU30875.1 hypothetical protein SIO17_17590 [Pseudoalteromonas piscicida]